MSKSKILVVGTGGLLKQLYSHIYQDIINNEIVFYDDINLNNNELYGCKVIHDFENLDGIGSFIIAVAGPGNREKLTRKCKSAGLKPINIIADDVHIPESAKIGEGVIILRNVIIEENVEIYSGALLNIGCYICHDSHIGAFTELGPRVTVLGNVRINNETFIGAGSVIREKRNIGNFVTIGMGSNVTKNIPNGCIAFGNPCEIKDQR
jgi:sugar O-acyltransferase (sialic acid O-acetyltransferase NeuD family)